MTDDFLLQARRAQPSAAMTSVLTEQTGFGLTLSQRLQFVATLIGALASGAASAEATPDCPSPELPAHEVRAIVERLRSTRDDLPRPFEAGRWEVRRQGCHSIYTEFMVPPTPGGSITFVLNAAGQLADVVDHPIRCPERQFDREAIRRIVDAYRSRPGRTEPRFPAVREHLQRLRCTYQYFEYAVPEVRGQFDLFTIDPYGEVMSYVRSKPY